MPLAPLCPGSIPMIFPASGLARGAGVVRRGSAVAGGLSGWAAGELACAPRARGVRAGAGAGHLAGRWPQVHHGQHDAGQDQQRAGHRGHDQRRAAPGVVRGVHPPQSVTASAAVRTFRAQD